ncbi:short-chain dehydrogenase/reductase sdr [Pyrenophora teres f. maculata]|nr:short-chain dehydrogenase/reductase sdr [Pyrenophora teres f. maculata]
MSRPRENSLWTPPVAAPVAQAPQLLSGKTMMITGGVTGIGRAIVLGYLEHGANVAVNHFDDAKSASQYQSLIEEAATKLNLSKEEVTKRLVQVPGDVGNPETGKALVSAAVQRWGRLDVVISNAGICEFKEFLEYVFFLPLETTTPNHHYHHRITPDLWSQTLSTNLTGAFHTIQAGAHQLTTQSPPGGSIIGISSISALVGGAQQAHYTPTKAGITSLIQSAACALGKYGIRCNALLPGTIKTQLNEKDLENEEKRKYMEGRIPLGRTGVPEDLVGPAVFLGSALSGYVNGAQVLVDGGLFVNLQ